MEKWVIRPAPTGMDPHRHLLLVKGAKQDVALILKRFGSLCGRPAPITSPEGFNFSLYLNFVNPEGLKRVKAALGEMVPGSAGAAPAPLEMPPPVDFEIPEPLPPPPPGADMAEFTPPVLQPPPPVEPLPPAPLPKTPMPPGPSTPLTPVEEAQLEAAAAAAKAAAPPPTPTGSEVLVQTTEAAASKFLWGLNLKLDTARNLDAMSVGAFNRFTHAAAASVVSTPGTMYNPLFLYGPPGTGKTHMLHAIGSGLAAALGGEDSVVVTSGPRLSRAVNGALKENRFKEIEGFLTVSKAFLVDDVHLLAVTEQNQAAFAKIFALFFERNMQVVMTSLYPPRALASLEQALNISLEKGWSVDLKTPPPLVQVDMIRAFCDRNAIVITAEEIKKFHQEMGNNFLEMTRWVRRLVALQKVKAKPDEAVKIEDLLPIIFEPPVIDAEQELPIPSEMEMAKEFAPPAPGPQAKNMGVLVPSGAEAMIPWVVQRFYQGGAQYGISQDLRIVLKEAYDANQSFGVPFQIAEFCQRMNVELALVLGPPKESKLFERSAEFAHAVRHILEGFDVAMGWVPHRETMAPSNFLRAHLDFLVR